jgi:hypothetical protein
MNVGIYHLAFPGFLALSLIIPLMIVWYVLYHKKGTFLLRCRFIKVAKHFAITSSISHLSCG